MKIFRRGAGFCLLLALFIMPVILTAQNDNTINVAGSGIVAPLFQALAEASGAEADINVNINGTDDGFISFCQGEADITNAARPISPEEEANCTGNNVEYVELLVGHNIMTLIVNPDLTFAQCLSFNAINTIFAPSAAGQIIDWAQIALSSPEPAISTPLLVFLPSDSTPLYAFLDRQVSGVGLRTDATIAPDDTALLAAVSATPGAIGLVNLNTAIAGGASILQVTSGEATSAPPGADPSVQVETGCYSPSAENVENRLYGLAERLFIYVNRASLEKAGLNDVLTYVANPEAATVVETAGFTAPTQQAYELNQSILAGNETGRQFSLEVVSFQIPPDVFGQITIGGAGQVGNYLNSVSTQFTTTYPNVTSTVQIDGEPAGLRRLCNGELDIVATIGDLSAEQAANCEANNINTVKFDLGKQVVVLVANADPQYTSDYLACLTHDQLLTIWAEPTAADAEAVTSWSTVDASFPEVTMLLFAPDNGTDYTDILLKPAEGAVLPLRTDTEVDADPLYRAAATANVEGALAYMSWDEYQSVLENQQERIQLVAVDGGNGCITPSEETIADGTYPLTLSGAMIVKQDALTRTEIQSFLWYLASDENFSLIEQSELIGLGFGDLPALRETLQNAFAEAQIAALEVGSEATPEATGEATASAPDSTVEATSEATAEATLEATSEATPEATAEATPGQ